MSNTAEKPTLEEQIDLLKQQLNADLLRAHKMFTLDPAKTIANC